MKAITAAILILLLCSTAHAQMGASLFPPASATDTAVQSGSWQDSATWQDGTVPVAGESVYIPSGVTVTNHGVTADVAWIHAAGTLSACEDCDTQLNVGTLYIPMGGTWDVRATGQCVTELLDASQHPGDWQKLAGGVISHGRVVIHGNERTRWDEIADAALEVDAVTLTLRNVPFGWQVGDRVIVAGTDSRVGETYVKYQSEFRTIAAISGKAVTLDAPLVYRHFRWEPDLKFHIANLTSNVVIRSRETETAKRGHLMFMSSDVDFRYVEMRDLGRTDKAQDVTDPQLDQDGNVIVGTDTNPRARYAWHVHRAGPLSPPARATGCVVDGSPGWGFLNHNSNCQWTDCIAIRCYGFGFGTEEGQERGYIRHCLSAMNHGLGETVTGTDDDHGKPSRGDWGKDGAGFWLQGGMVEVSDCVAFDNSGRGFGLFNRTLNGYPDYATAQPIIQYPIVADPSLLESEYAQTWWWQYRVGQGKPPNIPSSAVPIRVFRNNVAYGNKVGLQAWAGIHDNSNLGLYWPLSIRGSIENLTMWGRGAKLHCEYLRQCNIDRVRIVGDQGFRPGPNTVSDRNEAMLFRGPEITVTNWSVEHMPSIDYLILEPSPSKNIVIEPH